MNDEASALLTPLLFVLSDKQTHALAYPATLLEFRPYQTEQVFFLLFEALSLSTIITNCPRAFPSFFVAALLEVSWAYLVTHLGDTTSTRPARISSHDNHSAIDTILSIALLLLLLHELT